MRIGYFGSVFALLNGESGQGIAFCVILLTLEH